jgi:nucleotide-binding universal stress UspA family protein
MKNILIAVDDTKGAGTALTFCSDICQGLHPEGIVLLYVERFEGNSLMAEMLGDAEASTLREALQGSEYKESLDKKARSILDRFRKILEEKGLTGIKTIIKSGHPADEILTTAREEKAEMIVIGSRGKRTSHLFMGSISREVANRSDIPVLLVK